MKKKTRIYFSPRLRSFLASMGSKVASSLLSIEFTNIYGDMTLFDCDNNNGGYISFVRKSEIDRILNTWPSGNIDIFTEANQTATDYLWRELKECRSLVPPIWGGVRSQIKIGKFVNRILGDDKFNKGEIEEFVNELKALINGDCSIEVVEGDHIDWCYNEDNYLFKLGSLGNSCMSNKKGFFKIYTANPKTCKLVILRVGGKIAARALLWKIHKISSPSEKQLGKIGAEWFLDRVYAVEDFQIEIIRKWAIKRGYLIKVNNFSLSNFEWLGSIFYDCKLVVKVKPEKYELYPYMDTLPRCSSTSGKLFNDDDWQRGGHILRNTDGSMRESMSRGKLLFRKLKRLFGFE